ncbi:MAG: hypothetical protein J7J02_04130 [Sulfurovum sp.]|nr:hypothetical protein [Sulfurovum sp.]
MMNIEALPKSIIKSELKRKDLHVKDLVALLKSFDEHLTESSFNNKMSRGGFSAVFFMKCMKALEIKTLKIED